MRQLLSTPSAPNWLMAPSRRNETGNAGAAMSAAICALKPVLTTSPRSPMGMVRPPPTENPTCAAALEALPAVAIATTASTDKNFLIRVSMSVVNVAQAVLAAALRANHGSSTLPNRNLPIETSLL
jgi:hypothetical protein